MLSESTVRIIIEFENIPQSPAVVRQRPAEEAAAEANSAAAL